MANTAQVGLARHSTPSLGEVAEPDSELPGVADAAVVGVRTDGVEDVVAFVTAAPGSTLDPEAIRAASREHLAAYKVPKRVVIVDDLPKTVIGKLLRRELREKAE